MKKRFNILTIVFFLISLCFFSCRSKNGNDYNPSNKINPATTLLKAYYKNWNKFLSTYPVYMDSIKDVISIGRLLDSICSSEPEKEDQIIGIVYNLKDSMFVSSADTSFNIIIPCGVGNPTHSRRHISDYSSLIKIYNDSLTFYDENINTQTRLHVSKFELHFKEYLNKYDVKDLPSDEYVSVTIDIANNPHKEVFQKIFGAVFRKFYSEIFSNPKTNSYIHLDNAILNSQADSLMTYVFPQIRINLIRDNQRQDFNFQVLTPWQLQKK